MIQMTMFTRLAVIAAALAAVGGLFAGCGAADEEAAYYSDATPRETAGKSALMTAALNQSASAPESALQGIQGILGLADAPGIPGPAGAPGVTGMDVAKEVELETKSAPVTTGVFSESVIESVIGFDPASVQAALVQQERVIIRTVDMHLTVADVAASVDAVAGIARAYDGWVVSSDRSATHRGRVSVRVPAQSLEDVVMEIRRVGLEVEAESTTSQDVTDEYVDSRARLTSLRATEQALLNLFERADSVEAALEVQKELASLQAEIEALLGRIKFLEETAAFSLINVGLELAAADMSAHAGDDRTLNVGEPARFRATFTPPEGIESFSFTWDFGDGSQPVYGDRTVTTSEADQRVTATVQHAYADDLESPYIVSFDINGFGDAGQVEGEDTFTATVKEIPAIEVFMDSQDSPEEGEEIELSGSFTRPSELSDFKYAWNFGDGSPIVNGVPGDGVTRIMTAHTFENYRYEGYEVTLTVTAESEAGEVSGETTQNVHVRESQGLVIGGWSAGDNVKQSIRALSVFAQAVGTLLIWLVIFSPAWLILGGIVYGIIRLERRRRSRRPIAPPESTTQTAEEWQG